MFDNYKIGITEIKYLNKLFEAEELWIEAEKHLAVPTIVILTQQEKDVIIENCKDCAIHSLLSIQDGSLGRNLIVMTKNVYLVKHN